MGYWLIPLTSRKNVSVKHCNPKPGKLVRCFNLLIDILIAIWPSCRDSDDDDDDFVL